MKFWTRCLTAVLAALLVLATGCATDPAPRKSSTADDSSKPKAVDESLARQARQLRANSSPEEGTGLSDKSRDVERDLGFQ